MFSLTGFARFARSYIPFPVLSKMLGRCDVRRQCSVALVREYSVIGVGVVNGRKWGITKGAHSAYTRCAREIENDSIFTVHIAKCLAASRMSWNYAIVEVCCLICRFATSERLREARVSRVVQSQVLMITHESAKRLRFLKTDLSQ